MPVTKGADNSVSVGRAHAFEQGSSMEFFVPKHIKGRCATPEQKAAATKAGRDPSTIGVPYEFFRGIHHLPDALANGTDANELGIKPVEEMTDDEWRLLGLDREAWLTANRRDPEPIDAKPEVTPVDVSTKPQGKPVAAVSDAKAIPATGNTKAS